MNSIPCTAAPDCIDWLMARLATLLRAAPAPKATLLSISLDLPEVRLPAAPRLRSGDFYCSDPQQGRRLLGRGQAWSTSSEGAQRLADLQRQLQALLPRWRHLDPDGTGRAPLSLLAAAFDADDPMQGPWAGYPNARLFVPRLLWEQTKDGSRLVLSATADSAPDTALATWQALLRQFLRDTLPRRQRPAAARFRQTRAEPDDGAWLSLAARALDEIAGGDPVKLVLYRQHRLDGPAPDTGHAIRSLESAYPGCRLIALQESDSAFVCASPEQLLAKHGARIGSDALAGTAQFAAMNGPNLCDDRKIRHEHALVQRAVEQALRPYCLRLDNTLRPRVQRLGRLMHLHNRVEGRLRADTPALELAAALHPTPAVGGSPRQAAQHWLRRAGQSQRGWYSGFAGWLDRNGDAELHVLIRGALLGADGVRLFAGAGLVQGSNARDELAEIDWKLNAVQTPLLR